MTEAPVVTEFTAAAQDVHDAVLRLQAVLERASDHVARMRSMSDGLNDFKSTLDTPGKMKRLPLGIVPERKGEVA